MKNGVPSMKMQSSEVKDVLRSWTSLTKVHQKAWVNFMNGICSGLSALSTGRRIIVAESVQIVVK
jgi:hypothetical protein